MGTTGRAARGGRPRPGGRTWLLGLLALALLCLVAADAPAERSTLARTASWAVLWLASSALVLARALRGGADQRLWRAVALFVVVVGAALVAHPLLTGLHAGGALPLLPLALAVLTTSLVVYSAFVRWNLTRTHSGDPGDLLNAVSAVLTGQALLGLAVGGLVPSSLDLPPWQLQPVLASGAAAIVLTGTVLSTAMTAGGGRDRTAWLFVVGCAAALAGAGSLAVGTETGSPVPGTGAWLGVAAACAGLAAVLSRTVSVPLVVDGVSATVGAYAVLLLALLVITADGLLALAGTRTTDPWVLVAGGLGAAGAATRLLLNITELSQLDATRREAVTDELTGLANRRGVLRAVGHLHAAQTPFAVALLDLDRFKEVNDDLGHAAGDALLVRVARRLEGVRAPQEGSAPGVLTGRLGGDEFAVVVPLPPHPAAREAAAAAWSAALVEALAPAYDLGASAVHVGCSAGVVVHPADARPPGGGGGAGADDAVTELLRRADAAMYAAKRSGGGVQRFDPALHGRSEPGLRTAEELRHALEAGELVLHHQPQLCIATGEVVGVEALVRWRHPERGLLAPGEFLPVAAEHGLLRAITSEVLRQAVAQSARWRAAGLDVRMSANVSAGDLADPALPAEVAELLLRHGVPADRLVLEVTEAELADDAERAARALADLAELGVWTSIDDFGTGWSSLARLHRLRFTELKLDRSFTALLLRDPRAAAITASPVDLAHALGLRVVAEGVEDAATLEHLARLGCDESQGWLHAPAMTGGDLHAWVLARRRRAAAAAGAGVPTTMQGPGSLS